ncbi:MAG: thioesterase family protein [Thermoleophilia bacterium]|nr:acyl-CoA thioesterase [Gaiellaceae bacterium]MDW8338686.1 thioesterase family protein [Thermoleophilia bacterium]
MEGFSFSTEIRVRFAETDAQGIAHHASFVVWLEVARIAYLEAHAGGYAALRERGIEALTTEVHLRYRRAAAFDDLLTVWTRCSGLRGARFRYEYAIERGGELVAEGHTSHALVDRETYRPRRAPDWLVDAIARAEGKVSGLAPREETSPSLPSPLSGTARRRSSPEP